MTSIGSCVRPYGRPEVCALSSALAPAPPLPLPLSLNHKGSRMGGCRFKSVLGTLALDACSPCAVRRSPSISPLTQRLAARLRLGFPLEEMGA
ncbi:hypothetical protein AAFF_G00368350 [Aldrovandia affinis]|uniref:Uncharacterized protein n=1 Tax=Aldrovandia affinis TaxID=143900 RepID=A0AAD7SGW3_9TELE|nr:hypothetical protein AAFF_G00368350 [Aldrovandia affinis]